MSKENSERIPVGIPGGIHEGALDGIPTEIFYFTLEKLLIKSL